MEKVIVRYAEIALKGKNRPVFEKLLVGNIQRKTNLPANLVRRQHGQIIIFPPKNKLDVVAEKLKQIFGIAWFAKVKECPTKADEITVGAMKLAKRVLGNNETS